MLVTECLGDNFFYGDGCLVTNIDDLFKLASGTNIQNIYTKIEILSPTSKNCHHDVINIIKKYR